MLTVHLSFSALTAAPSTVAWREGGNNSTTSSATFGRLWLLKLIYHCTCTVFPQRQTPGTQRARRKSISRYSRAVSESCAPACLIRRGTRVCCLPLLYGGGQSGPVARGTRIGRFGTPVLCVSCRRLIRTAVGISSTATIDVDNFLERCGKRDAALHRPRPAAGVRLRIVRAPVLPQL